MMEEHLLKRRRRDYLSRYASEHYDFLVRLSYLTRPLGPTAWMQALDRVHEHLTSDTSTRENKGKLCVVNDTELYTHLELDDTAFAHISSL
jgi:hypothetical protein